MHPLFDDALVPFPTVGRTYRQTRRVTHEDVTPLGRARFDAIARWLQHLAYCDVADAGMLSYAVWIVRRTRIRVDRFPAFGEEIELQTACSGASGLTAEWRTTITGDQGARVEAATLWVSVDPATERPRPNPPEMYAVFGPSAGDRRVRSRLTHPPAPPEATVRPWSFRNADLDVAGHVNNAAYWQAIEEALGAVVVERPAEAEIEHHAAADAGPASVREQDEYHWIHNAADERCASVRLRIQPAG